MSINPGLWTSTSLEGCSTRDSRVSPACHGQLYPWYDLRGDQTGPGWINWK